jgi:hypothetical protein
MGRACSTKVKGVHMEYWRESQYERDLEYVDVVGE